MTGSAGITSAPEADRSTTWSAISRKSRSRMTWQRWRSSRRGMRWWEAGVIRGMAGSLVRKSYGLGSTLGQLRARTPTGAHPHPAIRAPERGSPQDQPLAIRLALGDSSTPVLRPRLWTHADWPRRRYRLGWNPL